MANSWKNNRVLLLAVVIQDLLPPEIINKALKTASLINDTVFTRVPRALWPNRPTIYINYNLLTS